MTMAFDKSVDFFENSQIIDTVGRVSEARGCTRSDFIRVAIRKQLAQKGFLDKKNLGLSTGDNIAESK